MRALILLALFLPGCGQQFAGAAYKVQVGRSVHEWADRDAATTWQAGAEFRFDVRR